MLTTLLAKDVFHQQGETSPLAGLTALAIHVEQHRLDSTSLPICLGREQLMAGAADLLGEDASFEDQDAFRLLALLLEKFGRVWLGSITAKTDEILPVKLLSQRELLSVAMPSNFTTPQLCTTLVSVRAINLYKSGY